MTTVTQIITDAFRVSNLIATGTEPTSLEQDEALRYLNRIVKSVFGNEAGDPLTAIPIGRNNISRPSGYPWWNTIPDNDWFVPKNTRAMLNLDQSVNLYLHPAPDDGSRFAAVDASETLSTYPVTVYGNGNLIDSGTSIVLNTDGFEGEWFYRADLASWTKYAPLVLLDAFPFPEEFDEFFIHMLALRLNPSFGVGLDAQSQASFNRAQKQIKARYTQNIPTRSELALIRMPKLAADRDTWGNAYWLYNPNSMFDKGWPW